MISTTRTLQVLTGMALMGCGEPDPKPAPIVTTEVDSVVYLDDLDYLLRLSMTLRGVRPDIADIDAVLADPDALHGLIDGYIESAEFLEIIRDFHAEMLLARTDAIPQLPALGPIADSYQGEIYKSGAEEPLKLVEHIVDNDLPYTEVLTADYAIVNSIVADMYGMAFDPTGPEWQKSHYVDGRPPAGLLSSQKMMLRHESNAANFHRGRANMVSRIFLCEDFEARDIAFGPGLDLSDEFEVAAAVRTNEACVGCHEALDPLAAYFWGFRGILHQNQVADGYDKNCQFDFTNTQFPDMAVDDLPQHYCYPLTQYIPANETEWTQWDLRPPSYFGQPADDLGEVGQLIAEDPRFSQCMARQFFGWFAHLEPSEVPHETAVSLQLSFEAAAFDAKALTRASIDHPSFRAAASTHPDGHLVNRMRAVRPDSYARTVEHLTGYRWMADVDQPNCQTDARFGNMCWGDVELTTSDQFGYRAMSGGIDGYFSVRPSHSITPTKLLVMGQLASDAAAFVVQADMGEPIPTDRMLLQLTDGDSIEESAVREQLAWLHKRILAEIVDADSAEVDASYDLFLVGLGTDDDVERAWTLILSALLQDVRMIWY